MASRGEDVSAHFTNKFTVVKPLRRVNVDLTQGMLRELDERAARLNVSRQAVVSLIASTTTKTGLTVRAALDEHHYETGVKVSDEQMAELKLKPAAFHGEWNYSIAPRR